MVPLYIYKDAHLRHPFTKAFNYENKGVNEQMKRSSLLQCGEVARYYVRASSLL